MGASGRSGASRRCDSWKSEEATRMSTRFQCPTLTEVVHGVENCEHCRTVTWAGVAACGCEFAALAVDEESVVRLAGPPAA
jgi:hypothetical protein